MNEERDKKQGDVGDTALTGDDSNVGASSDISAASNVVDPSPPAEEGEAGLTGEETKPEIDTTASPQLPQSKVAEDAHIGQPAPVQDAVPEDKSVKPQPEKAPATSNEPAPALPPKSSVFPPSSPSPARQQQPQPVVAAAGGSNPGGQAQQVVPRPPDYSVVGFVGLERSNPKLARELRLGRYGVNWSYGAQPEHNYRIGRIEHHLRRGESREAALWELDVANEKIARNISYWKGAMRGAQRKYEEYERFYQQQMAKEVGEINKRIAEIDRIIREDPSVGGSSYYSPKNYLACKDRAMNKPVSRDELRQILNVSPESFGAPGKRAGFVLDIMNQRAALERLRYDTRSYWAGCIGETGERMRGAMARYQKGVRRDTDMLAAVGDARRDIKLDLDLKRVHEKNRIISEQMKKIDMAIRQRMSYIKGTNTSKEIDKLDEDINRLWAQKEDMWRQFISTANYDEMLKELHTSQVFRAGHDTRRGVVRQQPPPPPATAVPPDQQPSQGSVLTNQPRQTTANVVPSNPSRARQAVVATPNPQMTEPSDASKAQAGSKVAEESQAQQPTVPATAPVQQPSPSTQSTVASGVTVEPTDSAKPQHTDTLSADDETSAQESKPAESPEQPAVVQKLSEIITAKEAGGDITPQAGTVERVEKSRADRNAGRA